MGLAFALRDAELVRLGLDFPQTFLKPIRAVTAEHVRTPARTYIHPDRLV